MSEPLCGNSKQDNYVEITPDNRHGIPPRLIHIEDVEGQTGFRSVYAYPRATCGWVMSNWNERHQAHGSVNGLAAARLPVYSDRLFIDIDDDPESARKFVEFFRKHNISHGVWDSGNRSTHIHVVTEPMCDWRVPYSQKKWVMELGEAIGACADLSIYHAAGLYRLPGTVHEKTGRCKVQTGGLWGDTLSYELVEPSATTSMPGCSNEQLTAVWRLLLSSVDQGGRHLHVFKIASNARRLGWEPETILEHARAWNSWQTHKLSDEEVETKVWRSV